MAGPASFGQLLRSHRHAAALTLEQLSERSGVSVRAISNMERGHSLGPQRKTLELLANELGLADGDRDALLSSADAGRRRVFEPAPSVLAMPRGVTDFVGRASELSYLAKLVEHPIAGLAPVLVVSGPPGVGKTSFAVHAASALAESFPDGQLFLDLRGLDERPLEPSVILSRLIHAVVPGHRDIPHDEVERAGLYRTLLAGRRVLIVLDNAADEAQVRSLLPAAGASMVLITSRRRLTGINTRHRLSLVPLSHVYAVEMLTNLMGERDDPNAVQRLAELGGNLPLALRLIGNRLASHRDISPGRFVQRLGDEERRLEALTAGDMRISAVFSSSYIQLSRGAQQLFRRLALIPGGDTGPEMAAVLADSPLSATELALDELVEFGLLQSRFTDRYRLHDLIRLFARARLGDTETPAEIAATQLRVESWLLSTATVAGRWFEPEYSSLPADWDERVPMDTSAAAQQWIESEGDNWLAAVRTSAAGGRFEAVIAVAEAMHWFSDRWPHWGRWTEVFRLAATSAQELGDLGAAATQLNYVSWALNICDGDSAGAIEAAARARAIAESIGDVRQQGWALFYLAWAQLPTPQADQAFAAATESVRLLELAGDRDGLLQGLAMVGLVEERLGCTGEALRVHRRRLALLTGSATGPSPAVASATELSARVSIGRIQIGNRDWVAVIEVLRPAVQLAISVGIPAMRASVLAALGEAECETGDPDGGGRHLLIAEELFTMLQYDSELERVRALLGRKSRQ